MINPFDTPVLTLFLLMVTSIAAGFDIRTHKIPNLLTFPAMLVLLGYYTALWGWDGFVFSAGGLGTGIALLLLPYLMGGMGAGDAKLMGVVGAALGMEKTITAFLFVAVMGCIYAFIVVLVQRRRLKGYFKQLWLTVQAYMLTRKYVPVESAAENRPKVYYGIAIAAGTVLYISLEFSGLQIWI